MEKEDLSNIKKELDSINDTIRELEGRKYDLEQKYKILLFKKRVEKDNTRKDYIDVDDLKVIDLYIVNNKTLERIYAKRQSSGINHDNRYYIENRKKIISFLKSISCRNCESVCHMEFNCPSDF